ncbi:glycine zipper 2TM domain-containing protein [Ramlibacter tataouinensis]|uniref:17 kDa surface antigen-like protein n=1 Tax=Ramlibacter tataouinensis (strain ATCC BAA-407 / DSM 14655 / LMG 21543 / TTB310) TaxID=365046 RepID=F5XZA6_RAMTT|nr:glycine zipper 2TM domain-containing protein [Ramlibacter tataouinensis]AEG93276.1 17 kDa surface antigen precursor-like protein [Ramlibacter tataouinensis TTB310]
MRPRRFLPLLLSALAVLVSAPTLADDDDDDDRRGRGHKHGHHKHKEHKEHKEEFWEGNCKIERKWEKNGDFKEERKCKGARPVAVHAAPAVVYPPWIVVQQGAPVYAPQRAPDVPASGVSRCQSQTVGHVLGGIVGGVLGNQIGSGDGRVLATVGGAVAGVLVGGEIGRRMDANNQACVGQVLEFAPPGRRVQWATDAGPYAVVPGQVTQNQGRFCRPYTFEQQTALGWKRASGTACRRDDGVWLKHS